MKSQIETLLQGKRTIGVICRQFGDTGKGKFVDYFAEWADIIARGTGGANAGHTIKLGSNEYIFHLIPSGILYDKDGKINIIGGGTAFDPGIVCTELQALRTEGLSYDNLFFSHRAKLVLPHHMLLDRLRDAGGSGKIGTTGRGIGPVYEDHYGRIGLTVNDLLNIDLFVQKLRRNLRDKLPFLRTQDPEVIKGIMHHEHLLAGRYWDEQKLISEDAIIDQYSKYALEIEAMIADTEEMVCMALGDKNILLEGAQGDLLSIDYGSYPYTTASDCTSRGLAKGVGIREGELDLVLGLAKAFYMTRVGEGPFPTELGEMESEKWCATNKKADEAEFVKIATVNDSNELTQGMAIRNAGKEYGATTGRARRVGWLDLPLLRYTQQFSSEDLILTKVDVLSQCEQIKICTDYTYVGPDYRLGTTTLHAGDHVRNAIPAAEVLRHCQPVYKTFPGWMKPIDDVRSYAELPTELQTMIRFIENETHDAVQIVSVGPERDQTIMID